MRIEKVDGKLLVWDSKPKNPNLEYDSSKELSKYSRRSLAFLELFLEAEGEILEANKIKFFLGKILRSKQIPKLTESTNAYRVNVHLNNLQQTIFDYIENYDLDLNPDFQRGHVWTQLQRELYVEFILQNGASNPIYFNHTNWDSGDPGEMVIVDGKQRLKSLLMFLNNEFTVFKNLDPDGEGYYAKNFDHFQQTCVIVINNLSTKKAVVKWYLEMNKGNTPHTEEELRRVEELYKKLD